MAKISGVYYREANRMLQFCASLIILQMIKVVILLLPSLKRQYAHQQNLAI